MVTARAWVPHKPEQRFSIAVARLLKRALLEPHYASANHDADGGARTDLQRLRDRDRGIEPGQLDWEVWQYPGLARRLELKRGKNALSDNQQVTIAKLTACGCPVVVAYTLREVVDGLLAQGFRFAENVATVLALLEAHLAAWDRQAEGIQAGTITKKKRAARKVGPRYSLGKSAVARARKAGIRV